MNENPLVTVYIPTYNRLELLKRAVKSVLDQDYSNIEVIVVDDGSSDGTVDYLKCVSQADQRVRYFVNEVNSGACVSRNKAIWAAKGEFITGLDDDDYFLRDHISIYLNCWLLKESSVVGLYSNIIRKKNGDKYKKAYPKKKKCSLNDIYYGNWPGNQIFIKTSTIKSVGGFDPKMEAWQDYECWFRILKKNNHVLESTGKYTYVLDVSHDHERISSSDQKKFIRAFVRYVENNGIEADKCELIRLSLINNGVKKIPIIKPIVRKIIYSMSFHNLRHTLLLIYFYFKSN